MVHAQTKRVLCTCVPARASHFSEFILKARKSENRIQGGLLNVTDLPVCPGCNFPNSQQGLCNLPATLFHRLSCIPLFPLFCFQRIAKNPKLDKSVLVSSELAHSVHPPSILQFGPYLAFFPGSASSSLQPAGNAPS